MRCSTRLTRRDCADGQRGPTFVHSAVAVGTGGDDGPLSGGTVGIAALSVDRCRAQQRGRQRAFADGHVSAAPARGAAAVGERQRMDRWRLAVARARRLGLSRAGSPRRAGAATPLQPVQGPKRTPGGCEALPVGPAWDGYGFRAQTKPPARRTGRASASWEDRGFGQNVGAAPGNGNTAAAQAQTTPPGDAQRRRQGRACRLRRPLQAAVFAGGFAPSLPWKPRQAGGGRYPHGLYL